MTSPRHRRERPLATVALITAFAFGCTTIRAPVATMGGPIQLADGAAAPQLELWLESADPIKPEEAARVSGQARAVLEAALDGRVIGDGSTVLVVRAQGVTRSRSHKNDQVGATVALAATAVVVVVGLVLLLASGGKGGGRGGGPSASPGRAAGHALPGTARPPPVSPAAPVAGGARAAPPPPGASYRPSPPSPRSPPVAARPPPAAARPPPYQHGGSSSSVAVGVNLDLGPVRLDPGAGELEVASSRDLPAPVPLVEPAEPPPAVAGLVPVEAGLVLLPPFPPLQVEERSFFDGDSLVLELTIVDRLTGEPRWTKWVESHVDPLDQQAVLQVVDRALGDPAGWQAAR
jgi:hypothetical protein